MKRTWLNCLRFVLGLYPFQIGKGWVVRLFKDKDIPQGGLVQTKDGVLVRTRPDYVFKHIHIFGEYEPVNVSIFRRIVRQNDVCVDVGANFGYYTCLFARWGAKQVYAFEPVPSTYTLNEETIRLNHFESIAKTFNIGLGDKPGTIQVYRFQNLSHGHASSCDLGRSDAVPENCAITTLDAFCAEQHLTRIDFIKIDVEGFEFEVLKGGADTLSGPNAPVVHFEVNGECMRQRQMDPNQIIALLKSYGYADFLQIGRYGGVRRAPAILPCANYDYLAFKDRQRLDQVLSRQAVSNAAGK